MVIGSKKIRFLFVSVCLTFFLFGCTNSKDKDLKPKNVKLGIVVPASHPVTKAMTDKFKPMIEEGTGGRLKVQIYEGGVLGGEKELFTGVKNGTIDLVVVGTIMWDEFSKVLIADWPFLYRDVKHARNTYTGDIGREIAREFKDSLNVHLLAWGPNGARTFSSNRKLTNVNDFNGQRIRMPNNPIHLKLASLLGANVISMNMGEVFGALEQKVIDGQDNPISTVVTSGWHEVQKYIYETNHMISSLELLCSDKFMGSLSAEDKNVLINAVNAAIDYSWDLYEKSLDDDRAFLKNQGITVTKPSQAEYKKMKELMAPLYEELYAKYEWADDLIARISEVK